MEQKYREILECLQNGKRHHLPLSHQEISTLKEYTCKVQHSDTQSIKQILCILDNTSSKCLEFTELLINILMHSKTTTENLVFALSCAQKHIVSAHLRNGVRFTMPWLDTLKKLLSHQDGEVILWTLKTIEQMGGQAVILKPAVEAIPNRYLSLNAINHQIRDLKNSLLHRWRPVS